MRWLPLLLFVLLPTSAMAAAVGNPKIGQQLVEKSCIQCHASMFGGDGSGVYTRPNRMVHNLKQLAARVALCNANTSIGWFPEEERDVTAFLNQQYYHFKQ